MPTIRAAGTTFAYQEQGSGEQTLLFMHKYLGCAVIWRETLPLLATQYRCIALDARGIGGSQRAAAGYTVEQWTQDVVAVADGLGVQRFGYVAHSMGALTGYRL
jgi:pimeloyl-ACP methyl ester carboxylesterase